MLIKMIIKVFTRIRPSMMSVLFVNDDGHHVVDNDDDDGDYDRLHQIKTSNDEGTLPQVSAPTTEAGNFTHLLCIIHLDGEGKG